MNALIAKIEAFVKDEEELTVWNMHWKFIHG